MSLRPFWRSTSITLLFAIGLVSGTTRLAGATPPACVGDCDGSNEVTVDEIVTMVATALGGGAIGCTAGDADKSGSITVDEVITAVKNALDGCDTPASTPTPAVTDTPVPEITSTHTETPTEDPNQTETPEPTATEPEEPSETETPEPTLTGGVPLPTRTPAPGTQTPGLTPTEPQATATAAAEPTATQEPAASASPDAPPTPTAVVPPSFTPMSPPTQTPGGNGGTARIDLGSASGGPGSIVAVAASLSGGNNVLSATSNDIVYDTTKVNIVQTGGVACTINPAIGQGSPYGKMLLTNVTAMGGTMARLRIGLISFSNASAIPDGLLFSCQFEISASAAPGAVTLQNAPDASNALGEGIAVTGSHGVIMVE